MYRNLEAEIVRKGSSRKEVAAFLGCTVSTLSLKMTEKTPFTLPEATKIKAFLDVDLSIEESRSAGRYRTKKMNSRNSPSGLSCGG